MDGARHQLLAGAALAQHQHRGIGGGHPVDQAQHLFHARAAGDDPLVAGLVELGPHHHVLPHEPALLGRLADQDVELLDAGRLGQVVVGPELHGLDRGGDLLEAGHHDHLWRLREVLQLAQHLDALHVGHLHVEQQHVGQILLELLQRGAAVGHPAHRVALPAQLADHQLAQVLLVVGHQHPDRRGHDCGLPVPAGWRGKMTRKVVPAPTRVSTSIRPSWSATIPCAMARPSPVPCPGGLVVKNGSKTRGRTCSGMPGPWSCEAHLHLARVAPSSRHGQRALSVHRVERIAREPEEHLAELAFVGHHVGQLRVEPALEAARGVARLVAHQLQHLVDQHVHVGGSAAAARIANEVEQAAGDLLAAVGLLLDQREIAREVLERIQVAQVRVVGPLPQGLRAARDGREGVVELVGHPRGEPARRWSGARSAASAARAVSGA